MDSGLYNQLLNYMPPLSLRNVAGLETESLDFVSIPAALRSQGVEIKVVKGAIFYKCVNKNGTI